ncbi:hypothetical protein GCM10009628_12490 [Paeniglutamicibacter kerguelensis]
MRGTATLPSTRMKANPAPNEIAKQPGVAAESPQSLLRVTAWMRGVSVKAINTVPTY